MKAINLNADATNLILDTDDFRHEIKTNDLQEENIDAYCIDREIIDVNTSLDFSNFAVIDRKNSIFTNAAVSQCI